MKIKIFLIFLFIILTFLSPKFAFGTENKFGIHILEPPDLDKAAELVNSSGGNWGYVTVVIRDDDLNHDKWQNFMDSCREKHLIPLVRIATHLKGENWVKPKIEDANKWADFLNNLNWPIKDQYVIIFNEPNQAKEWGGEVNPKEYAKILLGFSEKLHSEGIPQGEQVKSSNFMILNAGFDLAAGNTKTTMDAFKFWQEMNWEIPGIFDQLDGWSSHSYPNHGYLGKPWGSGRTSIRGYEWELGILKNQFKVSKELPVFITETGWPKSQLAVNSKQSTVKRSIGQKYYDQITVANYLKSAFEGVWLKDNRVKAITPFLLNYPEPLFSDFSWLDKNGAPYPQFETIKKLTKNSWWPEQSSNFIIGPVELPPFLLTNSSYKGKVLLENEGQSILGEQKEFLVKILKSDEQITVSDLIPEKKLLKPFEKASLDFEIKTGSESGVFIFEWEILGLKKIKVFKPTIITKIELSFWQKIFSKMKFW